MTVKDILDVMLDNEEIIIKQTPIKEIDCCKLPVTRQIGSAKTIRESNQNYLNFEVVNIMAIDSKIYISCKANGKQKANIIRTYKSTKGE